MFRLTLTVAALLVSATLAHAQSPTCQSPRPGPSWVCVGEGWLPPGHPSVPSTNAPTPFPIDQPQPDVPFKIGHRYWRNASGTPTDVYIMGAGQTADGVNVLFAQCRTVGDGCFVAGEVRLFLSNATAKDWEDRTNSPY